MLRSSAKARFTRHPPTETDWCAKICEQTVAGNSSAPIYDIVRDPCKVGLADLDLVAEGAASTASGSNGARGFAFGSSAGDVSALAPCSPLPARDAATPPSKKRRVVTKSPPLDVD